MVKPTTIKGSLVAIYLEDPATPGTYVKPCGLNNHELQFTKNLQEVNVPDCDDPDLAQWVERDVQSLDFSGTGEGVLAVEAIEAWNDYFISTDPINARVFVGAIDDDVNGYFWAGQLHINQFNITGNAGSRAQVNIGVASHGELVLTPVSALP